MDNAVNKQIYVLVELTVNDFEALESFEAKAVTIMAQYGGKLVSAFETERHVNTGVEVHLLSFPDLERFTAYRQDPRLLELGELRARAISSTQVTVSKTVKHYG